MAYTDPVLVPTKTWLLVSSIEGLPRVAPVSTVMLPVTAPLLLASWYRTPSDPATQMFGAGVTSGYDGE